MYIANRHALFSDSWTLQKWEAFSKLLFVINILPHYNFKYCGQTGFVDQSSDVRRQEGIRGSISLFLP